MSSDYDHIAQAMHYLQLQQRQQPALHGCCVEIEAVTPDEYRGRGAGLHIRHGVVASPFGKLFMALTPRGICRAGFMDSETDNTLLQALQAEWPLAHFEACVPAVQALALRMFAATPDPSCHFTLHIKGTNFQLAVWQALLHIPPGSVTHYSAIAAAAGSPAAVRAAGTSVGSNPVALLIPCHRVIRQSGALGGYRWGLPRKRAIQAWERSRAEE